MDEAAERGAGPLLKADGRTLFVMGNGPSLKAVDFSRLGGYACLGMNAAYRYWRTIDWRPRYYACLDTVVGLSHAADIAELIREGRIERFLLRANLIDALGAAADDPQVVNFDIFQRRAGLDGAPTITTGSHSVLWAARQGYDKIVLLGIDGRYREIVEGAARRGGQELEIVASGANPNYFFEGYQLPGDRYNLPNPRPGVHLEAWRQAATALEETGVTALNANPDSSVRCFPFVSLNDFLGAGAAPVPGEPDPPPAPPPSLASRLIARTIDEARIWGAPAAFLIIGLAIAMGAGVSAGVLVALAFAWLFPAVVWRRLAGLRRLTLDHLAYYETRLALLEGETRENDRQRRIRGEDRFDPRT